MLSILSILVTIVYILVCIVLILVVLLQAGRGGGMGTALGGGASQSVFGGSGGADFMAKLTQALAFTFMICAVFLAYASAHSGSSRLKNESEKHAKKASDDDTGEVDYERIGPSPLQLPPALDAPAELESAAAPSAPVPTEAGDSEPSAPE